MVESRRITEIAGEEIVLLAERAVWWPARQTVMVADVHLGKSETFRAQGVALPRGGLDEVLARLERCVEGMGAQRLVVLGDMVHAPSGLTDEVVERVATWREAIDAQVVLVLGNHDRYLGGLAEVWRMDVAADALVEGPFVLAHEPGVDSRGYVLAGHLHPTVRLGRGADQLRLPCFCFDREGGVLPAFNAFSNGLVQRRQAGRRLFVVADGEVIEV